MGNRYMSAECLYCNQGGKRWEQASTMLLRRYPEKISCYTPLFFCGIWIYSMHDMLTETMNHSDPPIKQKRLWEKHKRRQENYAWRHSKHVLTERRCIVFWLCTNLNPVRGIPACVGVCLIGVSSTNLYSAY